MQRRRVIVLLTGFAILALPLRAGAQSAPGGQAVQAYRPGLGDLMTATVQPRHIKLALAGREKNWTYAAYELHELGEAFERVERVWPNWRSKPIKDMVDAVAKEPMAALEQAIKAADSSRFDAAYRQLTQACNACHQSADRGMIVIREPDNAPFPDQDFRAVKP